MKTSLKWTVRITEQPHGRDGNYTVTHEMDVMAGNELQAVYRVAQALSAVYSDKITSITVQCAGRA